jgi:hypothetical protein
MFSVCVEKTSPKFSRYRCLIFTLLKKQNINFENLIALSNLVFRLNIRKAILYLKSGCFYLISRQQKRICTYTSN